MMYRLRHLEKRLGLERSVSKPKLKVSASSRSQENLGRSRLEQTFKRLGLERKGLVYIPGWHMHTYLQPLSFIWCDDFRLPGMFK